MRYYVNVDCMSMIGLLIYVGGIWRSFKFLHGYIAYGSSKSRGDY